MEKQYEDNLDAGQKPADVAARWLSEIELASKEWGKFRKRARGVVRRYQDERNDANSGLDPKRLNLLWSNTETIKPALYNETPKPEVARRNKDKDPVGREASNVLERNLAYCCDVYDFDHHMKEAVHDYTLLMIGVARVEYKAEIVQTTDDYGEPTEEIRAEDARLSYVHWTDFMTNVARTWDEVRWQSFRHFLTRDQLRKLSKEHGSKCPLDHTPKEAEGDEKKESLFQKAIVYEIWDKESGKVYWIGNSYKDAPLAVKEPFCKFDGFFCSPRPMMGNRGKNIIPTPDFCLYQDQADEIDELTDKIYTLTNALKVAGVYNGKFKELQKLVEEGGNTLIGVDDWGSFAQSGTMQGNIAFLPLADVAAALVAAYEARDRAKADLYEATGISDIVRGSSDPNETATAQAIKNQWGSLRIRDRQKEVQRFARDLLRLKAEVIAEKFEEQTIKDMSGVKLPTAEELALKVQQSVVQAQMQAMQNPQGAQQAQQAVKQAQTEAQNTVTWDKVLELLRNDRSRGFSIRIETDSTMEANEQEEKQNRIEFVTAVGQFLEQAAPIIEAAPETAQMLGEMLTFAVRGFKVGSQLEEVIETTMNKLSQRVQNPQPPQPDPDTMIKAQTEQQKLQLENKKADQEFTLGQQENQIKASELQLKAGELQHDRVQQAADNDFREREAQRSLEEQMNGKVVSER